MVVALASGPAHSTNSDAATINPPANGRRRSIMVPRYDDLLSPHALISRLLPALTGTFPNRIAGSALAQQYQCPFVRAINRASYRLASKTDDRRTTHRAPHRRSPSRGDVSGVR